MAQVFVIFYAPIIAGAIVRLLVGKRKKGYLVSVVSVLAACAMAIVTFSTDVGMREFYGLRLIMLARFAGGSLLGEAYFFVRKLMRKFRKR